MNLLLKPFALLQKLAVLLLSPATHWFQRHPASRRWLGVLRLGLFQFGIGLSLAPITGTLNRVLIDDLGIAAALVAILISIHYFVSPMRAVIGYRSDKARALGKWRTPYIVLGVMLTYGGLACAPFALILLGGHGVIPVWLAFIVCMLIFLAYGIGINIVETVYLALVSDITLPASRGKVLSVLWVMLILGTVVSAVIVSSFLVEYSHLRLIRVMQGSSIGFVVLTVIALCAAGTAASGRQHRLRPESRARAAFALGIGPHARRTEGAAGALSAIIFIATMAFATHDVLLEPYGGQVLGMSVCRDHALTVVWGIAILAGVVCRRLLPVVQTLPAVLIGLGCAVGLFGFGVVCYASDAALVTPFRVGVA